MILDHVVQDLGHLLTRALRILLVLDGELDLRTQEIIRVVGVDLRGGGETSQANPHVHCRSALRVGR